MGRNLFLGCAFVSVALLLAVAALLWRQGPRLFQKGKGWVKEQVADLRRISELEEAWEAPSAEPDWSWFPTGFENWYLHNTFQDSRWPAAGLERPLTRAVYKRGASEIEVRVFAVPAAEKHGLFGQMAAKLSRGAHSQVTTSAGNRFYLRVNGTGHTRLWWIKGWLFAFSAEGPDDPAPFMEAYLRAMLGQKPAEPDCCPGEPVTAGLH